MSCHLLPLLPLSRPLLLSASALLSRPRAAAARATAGALLLERCCVSAAAAVVLLLECCCWSAAARGHQRTFREEDTCWPAPRRCRPAGVLANGPLVHFRAPIMHQRTVREDGWPAGHQPSLRQTKCHQSLFLPQNRNRPHESKESHAAPHTMTNLCPHFLPCLSMENPQHEKPYHSWQCLCSACHQRHPCHPTLPASMPALLRAASNVIQPMVTAALHSCKSCALPAEGDQFHARKPRSAVRFVRAPMH